MLIGISVIIRFVDGDTRTDASTVLKSNLLIFSIPVSGNLE